MFALGASCDQYMRGENSDFCQLCGNTESAHKSRLAARARNAGEMPTKPAPCRTNARPIVAAPEAKGEA
jgi:hypothetical protein